MFAGFLVCKVAGKLPLRWQHLGEGHAQAQSGEDSILGAAKL